MIFGRFQPASALRIVAAAGLFLLASGCNRGILDPVGPVGAAEKTILINSTAIMLAIIIPTMIATVAFAWWFRRGNTKATYRPDWEYSGAIEMVVWAIPALTIMLLGGITWIGSHDLEPSKPLDFRRSRRSRSKSSRSIGNGCSSTPTRASRPSTSWSSRRARRSASG